MLIKKISYLLASIFVLGIILSVIYLGKRSKNEALPLVNPTLLVSSNSSVVDLSVNANGLSKTTAVIQTKYGLIKFKFYPHDAPKTTIRIIELIQKGFYNGLTFHRVLPTFVIQGGDPTGLGTGGSGQNLKAEFNNRKHIEGAIAMARGPETDSADSQFYISLGAYPHLDHFYTVFGQVSEGMDVVKKIQAGDKMLVVVLE